MSVDHVASVSGMLSSGPATYSLTMAAGVKTETSCDDRLEHDSGPSAIILTTPSSSSLPQADTASASYTTKSCPSPAVAYGVTSETATTTMSHTSGTQVTETNGLPVGSSAVSCSDQVPIHAPAIQPDITSHNNSFSLSAGSSIPVTGSGTVPQQSSPNRTSPSACSPVPQDPQQANVNGGSYSPSAGVNKNIINNQTQDASSNQFAQQQPVAPGSQPKRLHVSNIPFRFRDPDLRQLFGVSVSCPCLVSCRPIH